MHGFRIDNIRLKPVTYENENELLFPSDARKNYLNYFGTIYADVTQIMRKEDVLSGETTVKEIDETEKNVAIAKIPIMLKSKYCTTHIKKDLHGECKYDPGGIVLVNGQEKVIISIEVMVHNKVLVFTKRDNSYKDGKIHIAQINSKKNDWSDNLQILTIRNKKSGVFNVTTSQLSDVPIFILFKALGLESDRDIISNISYDIEDTKMLNLLRPSVVFSLDEFENPIRTREEAINFLITKLRRNKRISVTDEELAVKQKKVFLQKIFRKDLLPHLGDDIPKKIRFLGLMMNRLLNVMLERESVDDRDACQNKRVETPGVLVSQLFRQNWKKLLNEIGKNFRKKNLSDEKPINVISQIKSNIIEQGIKTALATGMWGMNKTKKGVAQSLQRLSWIQSISYLRRVMTPAPSDASAGIISIRHINNVSMYFLCPTETPEGAKIGIVKSLAMMSTISLQNDSQFDIVVRELEKINKHVHPYEVDPLEMKTYSKIYMNGNWIGCTHHIVDIFESLIKSRRSGIIDKMTSISCDFEKKEIKIYSDGGRLIRPLLNVENNKLVLNKKIIGEIDTMLKDHDSGKGWKKILSKYPNLIDYEDIESTGYIMVSPGINKLHDNIEKMNNKIEYKDNSNLNRYGDYRYLNYTHCEFHPWLMLGTVACTIPFSNHNYGTKNIVNFSQVKQSIGIYLTSHLDRMDISQLLYHPQLPVVTTKGTIYNRNNDLPAGENAIVAIMSYTGYNQEDSLIFNQSSIDRGIFRADTLKKYHAQIEKNPSTSQDDIFLKPDRNKVTGMKQGNYDKLNEKGFVPEETEIKNGDIIIGKVSPIQPTGNNNKVYKDNSEIFKSNVTGVIDRVHTGVYNADGYEMYNVRVRMERKPIIGDKFCLKETSYVLTNEGWIQLKDINIRKHQVATLKEGDKLDYVYPIDKYEFDCVEEELYHLDSQQLKIICTKNHKLYIQKRNKKKYEFVEAKDTFGKRVRHKKNATNDKNDIKLITIGDNQYEMDNFLKLLGAFICDGWVDSGVKHRRIALSMSKSRKKEFISETLDNLNIDYNMRNDRVLIGNSYKNLVDYFDDLSVGAANKFLPSFVWDLSQRQSIILMEALLQGDGSYNKQGSAGYYTSSYKLADDVQKLALHCGWSGTIKLYNGREKGSESKMKDGRIIKANYDALSIRIVKSKNNPQVNHGHVHQQNRQVEEYIKYSGKVSCIEVPETHLFYYKEDKFSPPCWTGNSSRHG